MKRPIVKWIRLLVVAILLLSQHTMIRAQIVYVDSTAQSGGDGLSWASAFKDLQSGLSFAVAQPAVREVRIAKGTYHPSGTNNRNALFLINRGKIKVIGGYASGGSTISRPNDFETVLTGLFTDSLVRCMQVLAIGGIPAGDSVILEGLTITRGDALALNGSGLQLEGEPVNGYSGGGIVIMNNHSSATIVLQQCRLVRNSGYYGAGLYCKQAGRVLLRNCLLNGNFGYGRTSMFVNAYGVGIYSEKTNLEADSSIFENQTVQRSGFGLGIYHTRGNLQLTHCVFRGNVGNVEGGGIALADSGTATITQSQFVNNIAYSLTTNNYGVGGAISVDASTVVISRCTFLQNESTLFGGAVSIRGQQSAFLQRNVFVQNQSTQGSTSGSGGAIAAINARPVITNSLFVRNQSIRGGAVGLQQLAQAVFTQCTFYGNRVSSFSGFGGAMYATANSGAKIRNSILWGDTAEVLYAPNQYQLYSLNTGSDTASPSIEATYSLLQAPFPISNVADSGFCLHRYPDFSDTSRLAGADGIWGTNDDGLFPASYSLAADAGWNSLINGLDTFDLAGNARIGAFAVDMGCFETTSAATTGIDRIANARDSARKSIEGPLTFVSSRRIVASVAPASTATYNGPLLAGVFFDTTEFGIRVPVVQRHYSLVAGSNSSGQLRITLYFSNSEFAEYNSNRGSFEALPVSPAEGALLGANVVVHQLLKQNNSVVVTTYRPLVQWNSSLSAWELQFLAKPNGTLVLNTSATSLFEQQQWFIRSVQGRLNGNLATVRTLVACASGVPLQQAVLFRQNASGTFDSVLNVPLGLSACADSILLTDEHPGAGRAIYRVRITGADGRTVLSDTVGIALPVLNAVGLLPNLLRMNQPVSVQVPGITHTLILYSQAGQMVGNWTLPAGVHWIYLKQLPGIYFYRLIPAGNGTRVSGGKLMILPD